MEFEQKLNTQYDPQLLQIPGLKWMPWIGENFNETKLFILGESQYEDGDGWQNENESATRTLIHKGFSEGFGRIQNITSKVLLSILDPTFEQKQFLWNSVIYYNLVQRLMSSVKERPTDTDFDNGWNIFLDIAEVIKPEMCLVLGKSSFGRLGYYLNNNETGWERNVSEFYEEVKIINLFKNGQSMKLIFINHPTGSRGFKYEYWADIVKVNAPKVVKYLTRN